MEFEIPVLGIEVDTEEKGETANRVIGGVAGTLGLFTIIGIARYLYSRGTDVATGESQDVLEGV